MTNREIQGKPTALNILLVTYSAYPRIGGRSTYITLLKKKLEQLGHTVDLLAHKPGLNEIYLMGKKSVVKEEIRLAIEQEVHKLHEENYPHLSQWIRLREMERYIFEKAVSRFDFSGYDLIHTQDIFSSLICPRIIFDKPIVASFHNCKVEEWKVNRERESKSQQEMDYIASEEYLSVLRPHKVIVPSQWLKNTFSKMGVPQSHCTVIPYGIDVEDYRNKMRKKSAFERNDRKTVILVPARMVPIKGHTYLFQALERLKQEADSFECWLAGDGVLETHLRREAEERNIDDKIRFMGGRHDIPTLMAMADMMVLPTLHDTFPFAIIEAQTAGVPVISTSVGGVVEMIEHGKTGLLGPSGDADFLYEAILSLMHHPELKHQISVNSRQFAETYWDVSRMIWKTLNVYQEVIERWNEKPQELQQRENSFDLDHVLLKKVPLLSNNQMSTGKIIGKIDQSSDHVGPAIRIHLMDISWITLKSTQPDAQGCFFFDHVPPGRYALMVVDGEKKITGHTVVFENQVSVWNACLD